jgi:two-component system LytT family response regulator
MAEIRALIVDDEPLARRGIRQLLAPYRDVTVVGECRDGKEAARALATTAPDLVFLDVQMPGLDGLDLVALYGADRMPLVVFVTAHQEYAVQAFEAQALDYLVKPLSEARFAATMGRLYQRLRERPRGSRILVPTADGALLLDAAEVDWIEAADDHSVIHAGPARHRVRQPLAALEARLDPERFVRVHRSAIVRLDGVREVRAPAGAETTLVLRDGTELPLSRRRARRVKDRLRSLDRSPRESDRSPRRV